MNKIEKIKTIIILIWFVLSLICAFIFSFICREFLILTIISMFISFGLLSEWNRGSVDLKDLFDWSEEGDK